MRWRTLKKKKAPTTPAKPEIRYAPFWPRVAAFATDLFMIGLPISLIAMALFGYDQMHTASGLDVITHDPKAQTNPPNPIASLTQIILYMGTFVTMWRLSGQTPGKKFSRIRVVDAKTFERAAVWQLVLRFLLYPLGFLTFFILFLRKDKRALHDLISGTAVIREA